MKKEKKEWKFQLDKEVESKKVDERKERRESDSSREALCVNSRKEKNARVWVSKNYETKTKKRILKGEKEMILELETHSHPKVEAVYPLPIAKTKVVASFSSSKGVKSRKGY